MFYDKFKQLCECQGISCNKAASEIGLSNATPTKWKKTGATPDGATLAKIADYFGVTTDDLLPDPSNPMVRCPGCGAYFNSSEPEDVLSHESVHNKWSAAVKKFGFCWPILYREKIKANARNGISEGNMSTEKHIEAQIDIFKALFSRSLESSGYSLRHVDFKTYVAMLLFQKQWKTTIPPDIYAEMVRIYGVKPGIPAGTYYTVLEKEKKRPTPVSESGPKRNVLRLAGRDGSFVERSLTDEQMAAIKMMVEQLPDADDL